MNSYEIPYVHCPFDRAHYMPRVRLSWHIAKCPVKLAREAAGQPIYRCKHFHLHIFLEENALKEHEASCEMA